MPRRWRMRTWIAIGLAIVVVLLGFVAWDVLADGFLIIRLRNRSTETLRGVEIATSVSATRVGDLKSGREKLLWAPELAEGNLYIRYQWDGGVTDSVEVQVYLQQESKGYVVIEVNRQAPARWQAYMLPPWDF